MVVIAGRNSRDRKVKITLDGQDVTNVTVVADDSLEPGRSFVIARDAQSAEYAELTYSTRFGEVKLQIDYDDPNRPRYTTP